MIGLLQTYIYQFFWLLSTLFRHLASTFVVPFQAWTQTDLWTLPPPVSASHPLFFLRSSLHVIANSFHGSSHILDHPLSSWSLAPAHTSPTLVVSFLLHLTNQFLFFPGPFMPPLGSLSGSVALYFFYYYFFFFHSIKCCHHFCSRCRSCKALGMTPPWSSRRCPHSTDSQSSPSISLVSAFSSISTTQLESLFCLDV